VRGICLRLAAGTVPIDRKKHSEEHVNKYCDEILTATTEATDERTQNKKRQKRVVFINIPSLYIGKNSQGYCKRLQENRTHLIEAVLKN
jgi:hypothetical protein